jgi:hypothetical protein
MKNKPIYLVYVATALLIVLAIMYSRRPEVVEASPLDGFAQCLASKDVTMYGAEWCPHCKNQKKLFGAAFQYVPYVECPENTNLCIAKGINGYPTWIFPDGQKLEGEQSLEKLSELSSCPLPQIN